MWDDRPDMTLVILKTVQFILIFIDRTVTPPERVLITLRTDIMRPRVGPEWTLAVRAYPGICPSADRTERPLFFILRVW